MSFYRFPAKHRQHTGNTNVIGSVFAIERLRTQKTKGCGIARGDTYDDRKVDREGPKDVDETTGMADPETRRRKPLLRRWELRRGVSRINGSPLAMPSSSKLDNASLRGALAWCWMR